MITNKLLFKKELIEKYLQSLHSSAESARIEMQEHQNQANEYGPPKDRYDSFRSKLLRMRDMFAAQYQKIIDEINIVEKTNTNEISERPGLGSVLILNQGIFFIAPGGGKIKSSEGDVFVITPQSPLFQALKDLKIGESFIFNSKQNTINNLF
jgi:hypothetical protein